MAEEGKAIILGCTHGGLAAARSLGKRGIKLLVLSYKEDEFGLSSRYVTDWRLCPHPRDEESFVDYLMSFADEWRGALLLETGDYFMEVLSRHKQRLSEAYCLVTPDWDKAQYFLEKDRAYRLADDCGVPHPKILEPGSMEELEAHLPSLTFPIMLKPVTSHQFTAIFKNKLFILETPEALRELFKRTLDAEQAVVISEIIPGTDYGTLERVHIYINSLGDLAAAFSHVKLRQTPPMYGVMRVGKSIPPNPEVTDFAVRLLKAVDYRGFASVEFKRDYRDNQLKLMEANIRMPRSSSLPIKAGVDFPYLIYQDLVKHEHPHIEKYHENTYLVDITADIVDFIRFDKERHFGQFVQPYLAKNKTFSVLDFDDPKPFLAELRAKRTKLKPSKAKA
jgi:D-aspartate ligase